MHIDLPQDILDRVKKRAALERLESEAAVIRKALDLLDWQDQERQAIQEGIDAWRAGDFQELEKFDADFRSEYGIRQSGE